MCIDCPQCEGSGQSPESRRIRDEWYGNAPFDPVAYGAKPLTVDHPQIVAFAKRNVERSPEFYGTGDAALKREAVRLFNLMKGQWSHHLIQADVDALVAEGRLSEFTRRPRNQEQADKLAADGGYWMREWNGYTPTADEINAASIGSMPHDSCNQWICAKARMKREGITETECRNCGGKGTLWPSPDIERLCQEWRYVGPPTGEGFQLWETTSEGSPVSPVFTTIEELCAWCADHATTFGRERATAEQWRKMLDADFVCHEEKRADGGSNIFI
jgi:hypothetical protein